MARITYVTGNPNKAAEVASILADANIDSKALDLPEIQSFSLEEIVRAKAERAHQAFGVPVLVEDVSLQIDALGGFPGPFVKFWAQNVGYDRAVRIAESEGTNRVTIHCGVGFADGNRYIYVQGELHGQLVGRRGESTFGFDMYVQPDGFSQTFAEMSKEEKNKISHRRRAFDLMRERLLAEGIL